MTDIILIGCNGKMGNVITNIVSGRDDCRIVAGIDYIDTQNGVYPVYKSLDDCKENANVIIDFSGVNELEKKLDFSIKNSVPIVIGTTGFSDEKKAIIEEASKKVGVFFTYNMSIGVNLLAELAKKAVNVLGNDFDIEIVEKHHNQKIDAPSGTALMLADAISEEFEKPMKYEYDRHSKREKRSKNEIGIHAVRGGTIVGEHEIIFAGRDEIITLSHSARSKEIFAVGAVNAAVFMNGKGAGMYTMKELVEE